LWRLVRKRSGHVDRLRHLYLPAKGKAHAILQDHQDILEALEMKAETAAEAALR
jgi:DNA-binding GntR family transcriptional regulator